MTTSTPIGPARPTRRWLPQFGMRAIFLLVALAALLAWWARGEMLAEQRRREVLEALEGGNNLLYGRGTNPPWRRRIGAWLLDRSAPRVVDQAYLKKIPDMGNLRDFIRIFPNAELNVYYRGNEKIPELLDALAESKSLQALDLFGPIDANDDFLKRAARVRAKGSIVFGVERVDDELLRRVANAKVDVGFIWDLGNEDGTLGWNRVTDEGLGHAATLPHLHWLSAHRLASDRGIAAFRDHPTLDTVHLSGPGYTDASADVLASLGQLDSLEIIDTRLSDAGIAKAIRGRKLRLLTLANADVGEETIAVIAGMKTLREISLENVPLSPKLAAALVKQPLETLRLRGDYTDADLNQMASVAPTLTGVFFDTPNVTDMGLAWLARTRGLNNIQLSDTAATAKTMEILASKSQAYVSLGGPHCDAAMVRAVQRAIPIRSLSLYGPTIDDEVLAALDPTSVSDLQLAGTRVTLNGLKAMPVGGTPLAVTVVYPGDQPPPFTQQELAELKQANGIDVALEAEEPAVFDRKLPRLVREAPSEAAP